MAIISSELSIYMNNINKYMDYMEKTRVLVLGASGYVGSQLIPQLLEQKYEVIATARQIDYLRQRVAPHPDLTIEFLDLSDKQATLNAVKNVDIAFFLVHGMAQGYDFLDYELSLAINFCEALDNSDIKHVIYLSSLQPQTGDSRHLKARRETGETLRLSKVPVTELRAGVIIGAGSAAFEIMRDFTYNLPVIIAPKWIDSKANPIALENLNHYLLELAKISPTQHQMYEAGGPDIVSYRQQFEIISDITGEKRQTYSTALLTPAIAGNWLGLVTSVPSSVGRALLAGLTHDFIADNREIRSQIPQSLISFEDAVANAIASEGKYLRSNVWGFDPAALKRWQPGFGYYPKQTGAKIRSNAQANEIWTYVKQIGSAEHGYFFATGLWRLREWLDVLFGSGLPIRQHPSDGTLKEGDFIDSWKVIKHRENEFVSLLFGMKGPGLGRLEFTLRDHGEHRKLEVKAWWHPKGFLGLLYWFAMMPAHLFVFKGMVKAITKLAERNSN
ncbi:putative nucleoside-diphosphate-sugar epimerase [Vibrio nigripulchritudo SO65]|nr:putative nucleoside-diphosphate-sugar epimerase [Vibrio nigripulchritudo AM115]CCN39549.1 putative nucleoside-diphosphate-sugar epimerase [Vibrio nigripulchritudo FTn2]CCN66825.1 putative nucleoside-diphosphate-sugar epimerase [Vibrio nigripulchritudo POn4]CCN75650.1 putative nucleoside-diphosphate-sugar epimerase [Vibrio nigripulchritudo SO65]